MSIVNACRDRDGLRFDYRDHHEHGSTRAVEPHRLVFINRKWYLVAYDLDRADCVSANTEVKCSSAAVMARQVRGRAGARSFY
ncbi:WYL domain-containing protein [Nocardia fluminea]|uniref:WYL domain-containing protein n=1 Tax=Nocardia fluminea TaxID=134984 RepID=UPI000C70B612|nr:WYL domain-containing protein [Nocardia fluminea]